MSGFDACKDGDIDDDDEEEDEEETSASSSSSSSSSRGIGASMAATRIDV